MYLRPVVSCVVALLLVFAGTTSASAQIQVTRDAKGDVAYWESSTQTSSVRSTNIDILRTRVRYENGSLAVRTLFRDLTVRNTTITQRVTSLHNYWLDTNRDRRGYEYFVFDARGEDLHRQRRGADRLIRCKGLSWRANLSKDITTLVIPRSCFRTDERRVVRIKFTIQQTGPGRTPAGENSFYMDMMEDTVVTGYVRHTRVA
jgi:hypothetical protein